MPVPMRTTVVLIGLALLATATPARGSLVVIPFAGPIVTVSSDPGPLPGFTIGEPVSGQLSYDPTVITTVFPQPSPENVFYRLPVDLQVVISGVIRFSGPVDAVASVRDLGPTAFDLVSFQPFGPAPPFLLALIDHTGTALDSAALPGTLDPTAFGFRSFGYAERVGPAGQGRSFRIDFGPEPVGTLPVPEPPTGVLALAGLAVAGGWAAGRRWGGRSRP